MKISVILPVYNKAGYITNMLQDLFGQTFRDFECLIVDDGSTDGSGEICDRIAGTDERLHVFHIPNGGVSHARNFALDRAEGTYITFVDGDDRLAPQYLEDLYTAITESGADLVIGNLQRLWSDGTAEPMPPFPYAGVVPMETLLPDFVKNQTKFGFYGFCVSKIFPRTLAEDIRFDESIRLAEDFDFYLKLYPRIQSICFDHHCNYLYLQFAEQSSQIQRDDEIDYVSQFVIRLRWRAYLMAQGAYCGENKQLLDEIVNNFIFCSLFYLPLDRLAEVYRFLWEQVKRHGLTPVAQKRGRVKWVLHWFWNRKPGRIRLFLMAFRGIRRILKGR